MRIRVRCRADCIGKSSFEFQVLIRRAIDPAGIIASVFGTPFYRRWFSREALDERFVKLVVKRAISSG